MVEPRRLIRLTPSEVSRGVARGLGPEQLVSRRQALSSGRSQTMSTQETSKVDLVRLDSGEYISKESYNSLPKDAQDLLNSLGIEGFNREIERLNLEYKKFEEDNVEVSPGKWVNKEEWSKLSSDQQKEVKETGSYTIVIEIPIEVFYIGDIEVSKKEYEDFQNMSPEEQFEFQQDKGIVPEDAIFVPGNEEAVKEIQRQLETGELSWAEFEDMGLTLADLEPIPPHWISSSQKESEEASREKRLKQYWKKVELQKAGFGGKEGYDLAGAIRAGLIKTVREAGFDPQDIVSAQIASADEGSRLYSLKVIEPTRNEKGEYSIEGLGYLLESDKISEAQLKALFGDDSLKDIKEKFSALKAVERSKDSTGEYDIEKLNKLFKSGEVTERQLEITFGPELVKVIRDFEENLITFGGLVLDKNKIYTDSFSGKTYTGEEYKAHLEEVKRLLESGGALGGGYRRRTFPYYSLGGPEVSGSWTPSAGEISKLSLTPEYISDIAKALKDAMIFEEQGLTVSGKWTPEKEVIRARVQTGWRSDRGVTPGDLLALGYSEEDINNALKSIEVPGLVKVLPIVGGLVTSARQWEFMSPLEKGFTLGGVALDVLLLGSMFKTPSEWGSKLISFNKVSVPTLVKEGETTVWKGVSILEHPVFGRTSKGFKFGAPSEFGITASEIKMGYYPQTLIEKRVMTNPSALRSLGILTEEAETKLKPSLKFARASRGYASPYTQETLQPVATKTLSKEGVAVVDREFAIATKDTKGIMYGSRIQEAELAPEVRGIRTPAGDIDIQLFADKEYVETFTKNLVKALQDAELGARSGIKVRISPTKSTLIESQSPGQKGWAHAVDIHSLEEAYGAATAAEKAYGIAVEGRNVTFKIPRTGGLTIQGMGLGEQSIRKIRSLLNWTSQFKDKSFIVELTNAVEKAISTGDDFTLKGLVKTYGFDLKVFRKTGRIVPSVQEALARLGPAPHRFPKDVIDAVLIEVTKGNKAGARQLAEAFGLDFDAIVKRGVITAEIEAAAGLRPSYIGGPSISKGLNLDKGLFVGVSLLGSSSSLKGFKDYTYGTLSRVKSNIPSEGVLSSSLRPFSSSLPLGSLGFAEGLSKSYSLVSRSVGSTVPSSFVVGSSLKGSLGISKLLMPYSSKAYMESGGLSKFLVGRKLISSRPKVSSYESYKSLVRTSLQVYSEDSRTPQPYTTSIPTKTRSYTTTKPYRSLYPLPGSISPPPPPPPPPKEKKRVVGLKDKELEKSTETKEWPTGTIVWRQGLFWKVIPPPYNLTKPYSFRSIPKGVTEISEGPGSAYKTIQVIGGPAPYDISVDLGFADIEVSAGEENPSIRFKGGGLKTNIGVRDTSTTRGISIRNEPKRKSYNKQSTSSVTSTPKVVRL